MLVPMDSLVAQAVHAARLAERALHDAGPWTMMLGSVEVPAVRTIFKDRIVFEAMLPPLCLLSEQSLMLLCYDEVLSVRPCPVPTEGGVLVQWDLRVSVPVSV